MQRVPIHRGFLCRRLSDRRCRLYWHNFLRIGIERVFSVSIVHNLTLFVVHDQTLILPNAVTSMLHFLCHGCGNLKPEYSENMSNSHSASNCQAVHELVSQILDITTKSCLVVSKKFALHTAHSRAVNCRPCTRQCQLHIRGRP